MSLRIAAIAWLLLAYGADRVAAQSIRWHTDPQAALAEARERRKPIVYDFGTADCVWCRRLDETTFRDPAVLRIVAERFVMAKIDAEHHMQWVQSLGIRSYPTLMFASPDGKWLGRHEGYVEADRFRQQLDRAWRDSGLTQTAAATEKAAAPKSPTIRLSMPEPNETARVPAETLALQLLYMAKEDFRVGQFMCCLERCRRLAADYPQTPAASEASRLAGEIKADPKISEGVRRSLAESLGELQLAQAESAIREQRWTEAHECLQIVLRTSQGTHAAATAEEYLQRWRNRQPILRP